MLKSTAIRKFLVQEAYLKYCDDPENFKRIQSHVTRMSFSDLMELDKKYNLEKRRKVLNESVMGVLGGLIGLVYYTPLWIAHRSLKAMYSKCERKCNPIKLKTDSRNFCVLQCKLIQFQKALALARQAESKCGNSKNPTMCTFKARRVVKRISDEIINVKLKMAKVQERMI